MVVAAGSRTVDVRSLSPQISPRNASQHLSFELQRDCKQSLVPAVPKYDGAKQRGSEWPLSSVMSLDLRGFLHSAPLLPLKVFQ